MRNNVKLLVMVSFLLLGVYNHMICSADSSSETNYGEKPLPYETKTFKVTQALKPIVDLCESITKAGVVIDSKEREFF